MIKLVLDVGVARQNEQGHFQCSEAFESFQSCVRKWSAENGVTETPSELKRE